MVFWQCCRIFQSGAVRRVLAVSLLLHGQGDTVHLAEVAVLWHGELQDTAYPGKGLVPSQIQILAPRVFLQASKETSYSFSYLCASQPLCNLCPPALWHPEAPTCSLSHFWEGSEGTLATECPHYISLSFGRAAFHFNVAKCSRLGTEVTALVRQAVHTALDTSVPCPPGR